MNKIFKIESSKVIYAECYILHAVGVLLALPWLVTSLHNCVKHSVPTGLQDELYLMRPCTVHNYKRSSIWWNSMSGVVLLHSS